MTMATAAAERQRGRVALGALVVGVLLAVLMIAADVYGATVGAPAGVAVNTAGMRVDRNTMGAPGARVQIVIYNDFQCIYCRLLHTGAEAEIIEQYVRTGKARLEVRQYPTYGEESLRAAEAAYAAADQGKYWEYRDLLFRNQKGVNKGGFSDENLLRMAGELGLDQAAFSASLSSGAHRAEVELELQEAEAAGVNSVPTVFINGRLVEGAQPFAIYQKIIEEELAK